MPSHWWTTPARWSSSYEGVFAAANGPASGLTSVDIGALQNGNGPLGETLQRNLAGTWTLAAGTLGTCNDNGGTNLPVVASVTVAPDFSTILAGSSITLVATAFDASGTAIPGAPLTWSSSDDAVATVGPTGVVTGISEGIITIYARSTNGAASSCWARRVR